MACHCGWGGKLTGKQCPGELVGDGQPTDFLAGRQLGLLDRVDLPNLMGNERADQVGRGTLRSSRSVDAGPLKGTLKHAHRGNELRREVLKQFPADPAGTPGWVVMLELTCRVEKMIISFFSGFPARMVLKSQSLFGVVPVGAPKVTNGVVRKAEFGGNLRQALAVEMTADDVQASLDRKSARHGKTS